MVSKEPSKCLLTTSESEVEPAASLALEMKYALDPNRQIKKRNKALQVRFKDICEAQNEQRDKQLSTVQDTDKREAKAISYKTAYRKYMTVPARRSIPNVTKSTGVQTSPDLKKCYQTFPLDRKKGNIIKSASAVDTFKSQNNGFLIDIKDKDSKSSGEALQCSKKGGSLQTAEFISHCPAAECRDQTLQLNVGPAGENQPCRPAGAASEACQQIVPHTEVVDLKAQLQMMESLISSSQETIKVLLGVIQELEKGEAHREGLSYRTGQDTANCDTCRNSACIIYSVELDFKQQEDKLQPVLRKLHPIEETQVAPLPYSQEGYSSTPKQKSKTESKKHGRWKLWFL
ncbi:Protein FAM196A [Struthio camelus australis]|uniref:Protein FAM196A n=1 Tax=Struthio camelus australis TaxID=441894 RepID=A0A093HJ59_STRCA|nr:Protein FAM196A [Struthio camelus australis]